jgi:hypothetical protein
LLLPQQSGMMIEPQRPKVPNVTLLRVVSIARFALPFTVGAGYATRAQTK